MVESEVEQGSFVKPYMLMSIIISYALRKP